MTKQSFQQSFELDDSAYGQRLDQALAQACPEISRSKLQQWIKQGAVLVNGEAITKARIKLSGGEIINIDAEIEIAGEWQPQDIHFPIEYEDESIIVINKPAGMVVHPAVGNHDGTLVNALLFHEPELRHLPRAGIIHRLDKDTSGLLVVAKTLQAHTFLVSELQERAFEREYQCLVHGHMVSGSTVAEPIGRHPQNRIQMAVVNTGKEAITHYRLRDKYKDFTHLKVNLETGRTHQIRVHMAHIRYPLVGDQLYGRKNYAPSGSTDALKSAVREFRRQALHARKLGFLHPETKQTCSWEVEPPQDYLRLIETVAAENSL